MNEGPYTGHFEKLLMAESMLKHGGFYVYTNTSTVARRAGLEMPSRLFEKSSVVFQIAKNLPTPIIDLKIDYLGIGGILSFRGVEKYCFIPWNGVYCLILDNEQRPTNPVGKFWAKECPVGLYTEEENRKYGPNMGLVDYATFIANESSFNKNSQKESRAKVINLAEYRKKKEAQKRKQNG